MNRFCKTFFIFLFLVVSSYIACIAGAQEYGGGPIVFIKPVRAVIFEHRFHLGKKITCQSCHPDLFVRKAAGWTNETRTPDTPADKIEKDGDMMHCMSMGKW